MNKFEKLLQETKYKIFKGYTDDNAGGTLSIIVPNSCIIHNYNNGGCSMIAVGTRNLRIFSPDTISIFRDKPAPKMCTMEITVQDFNSRVNIIKRDYYNLTRYYIMLDNKLFLMIVQNQGDEYMSSLEYFGLMDDESRCYTNQSNTFIDVIGISKLYKSKFNHISPLFTFNSSKPENEFDRIIDVYYKVMFSVECTNEGRVDRIGIEDFIIPSFLLESSSGLNNDILINLANQVIDKYIH